jgi:AcrR family transcriptional regulator
MRPRAKDQATGQRGKKVRLGTIALSEADASQRTLSRSGRRVVKASQRSPRREQIIERAVVLMQEKGYLGTSIQDVADELEFTKAAFYYFVKNKEELLYTIFQRAMDVALQGMGEVARSDASASQKLLVMIEGYLAVLNREHDLFTVLFQEQRHLLPEHQAAIAETQRQILGFWKDVFAQGVASGDFAKIDPTLAAEAVVGMCSWAHRWFNPNGRLTAAEVADGFHQMLLNGVSARPR